VRLEPDVDEHRKNPRRRLLKAGTIALTGGGAIDCTVRNISETGAALEVISPIGIPDQFALVIEARTLQCQVVRRTAGRIGVRFISGQAD
jgi:hypothetical protein